MENKVKFKIIKEYPGSRPVNTEFTEYYEPHLTYFRKYPEYFEEIKEEKTFTTHDNVEVKKGDIVYIHSLRINWIMTVNIQNIDDFIKGYGNDKYYLVYHSIDKAKDTHLCTIPCLSVNDIINYFNQYKYFVTETTKKELLELAKSKTK